jgi:hypothetical protein
MNIKKHADGCHFIVQKLGPAKIIKVLEETKFIVLFKGVALTVNGQ